MSNEKEENYDLPLWKRKPGEVAFLSGLTGLSVMFGFGLSFSAARHKDSAHFFKGLIASKELPVSGGALAFKALRRATFYTVTTFGVTSFVIWKLMGVKNMREFTAKVQSVMPALPKKEQQGKNDFKTVEEFVDYVVNDGEKGLLKQKEAERGLEKQEDNGTNT